MYKNNNTNYSKKHRDYYTNSMIIDNFENTQDNEYAEYFDCTSTCPAGIPSENLNSPEETDLISDNNNINNTTAENKSSYLRFYNLTSAINNVNVFINGREIISNLAYMESSDYIELSPGIYDIEFYSSSNPNDIIYDYKFRGLPEMKSTLAISEYNNIYSVSDISGNPPTCLFDSAFIRFLQTASNAPAMDIYIDDIQVIAGIRFGEASAYIGIPQGVHNIIATASGTGIVYINENLKFLPSSINDMYISSTGNNEFQLSRISDDELCIDIY